MDEDLKEKIKKLEKRVKAIEDYLSSLPAFFRVPQYDEGEGLDEMYDQAVSVVLQHDKVSASTIQRHLQVGFNRAARLLEQLEANGLVGPANGIKPRDVLIKEEDLENLRQKLSEKKEKKRKN